MNNQIRLGQIATQLGYVGEAIAKTKQLMPRPLPIFGFSGAPVSRKLFNFIHKTELNM